MWLPLNASLASLPLQGRGGVGVLPLLSASLIGPACRSPLCRLSVCVREAGWWLSTRSIRIQPGHGSPGEWGRFLSPALLALQKGCSLEDSVGDPGDRRERSSGLQILNQGQSEEKSEGLRGHGQSPMESPQPAQGPRGPGWGRGWRAQSSLEERQPQEGLNNETLQLLTEPLSEGCL